jgi:hypothetical protein
VGLGHYPAVMDLYDSSILKFARIVVGDYKGSKMGVTLDKSGVALFNWSATPRHATPNVFLNF